MTSSSSGPATGNTRTGSSLGTVAGVLGFVGLNDPLHQRMANHIPRAEHRECDSAHSAQDVDDRTQSGLFGIRQINLRNIASDYRLGSEADARQKHLHLFIGGVLRLVE